MSKKRSAPAAGGTATRAETVEQTSISRFDSTAQTTECQGESVADYLNVGEAGAVPMRHLMNTMRMDSRSIRLEIEAERRRGIPICANNVTGYFIAGTQEERSRFVQSMRHRAAEIMATADAVEQAEVD